MMGWLSENKELIFVLVMLSLFATVTIGGMTNMVVSQFAKNAFCEEADFQSWSCKPRPCYCYRLTDSASGSVEKLYFMTDDWGIPIKEGE